MKYHITNSISILEKYYLNDDRYFCIAFSGGKDSTVVLLLVIEMLMRLKLKNIELKKTIYIVNSNTLAELPPMIEHNKKVLKSLKEFSKVNQLPLNIKEVTPKLINTLNVQLFGIGMPLPNNSFRWCTTKLKIMPIEEYLKDMFNSSNFISVIGSRKEESKDRAKRLERTSIIGSDLKINTRYKNAYNLAPIENWTTKQVWEFLLQSQNSIIDTMFLWKLYSDASGMDSKECSFVGAGGKHIKEGKIGCGVSRFGCWQCYLTRNHDKSLDGLYNSGYENIEHFKEFREWYYKYATRAWEITRDPYAHNTHKKSFYNKKNLDYEVVAPRGIKLEIRTRAFIKLLKLNKKILNYNLISKEEIYLIQDKWLKEGDFFLTAIKIAKKYSVDLDSGIVEKIQKQAEAIKQIYDKKHLSNLYSDFTKRRYAAQKYFYPKTIDSKFFPTIKQEKEIKKLWKNLK